MGNVAWRTQAAGIESIVPAPTRNKAKHVTCRAANDACYKVKYARVRAVRAAKYDAWAKNAMTSCYSEEIVKISAAKVEQQYIAAFN